MRTILLVVTAALLTGCASSVPTTASLSEAVLVGSKASLAKSVTFAFESSVTNGVIKPCQRGTREAQRGHPGFLHSEPSTFGQMLQDYVAIKFPSARPGEPRLVVKLNDFWVEQYSPESTGKQMLVALGGGELNVILVAHLDLSFSVSTGETRNIRIAGDSAHVAGIGTGTETSRVYRGRDSLEFRLADAISAANNKAILALNGFIDSSL